MNFYYQSNIIPAMILQILISIMLSFTPAAEQDTCNAEQLDVNEKLAKIECILKEMKQDSLNYEFKIN